MLARLVLGAVTAGAMVVPAFAGMMNADEARKFVAGKVFAFTCFDGTRGAGRILDDMLLGVDRADDLSVDPLPGQRTGAVIAGVAMAGLLLAAIFSGARAVTGAKSSNGALNPNEANIVTLARSLFTDYVFAFELTSALLVIAVVGAVVLARRDARSDDEVIP